MCAWCSRGADGVLTKPQQGACVRTVALLLEDLLEAADGHLIFEEVLANRAVQITERTRAHGRQVVGLVGSVLDPDAHKRCRERRVYRDERRDGVASVLKVLMVTDGVGVQLDPLIPGGCTTLGAQRWAHTTHGTGTRFVGVRHTPKPSSREDGPP